MKLPRQLLIMSAVLALEVVALGAYVRLSDAGLGCPDWPGCYGRVSPWHAKATITAVQAVDPVGPVSHEKAWKEMAHRYMAGGLGLCVMAIAILAWRRLPPARRGPPTLLLGLLLFQAMLGMWTVTQQLKPMIVALHLLGGMATLALLAWLAWGGANPVRRSGLPRGLARGILVLLLAQIALGGWVSANGAGLACPDLPLCRDEWWPTMDFYAGFGLSHALGGLDIDALAAIQVAHRLGALAVLAGVVLLAWRLFRTSAGAASLLLALVSGQVMIGMANVLLGLPLPLAMAHNIGAAALLLAVVWINLRYVEDRHEHARP